MTVARMPGRNSRTTTHIDTRNCYMADSEARDHMEAIERQRELIAFADFCGAAGAVLAVIVIAVGCSVAWFLLGDHP